jgi:hypothetical protein
MFLIQCSGSGTFDADMDMWNCGSSPLDCGSSGSQDATKFNFLQNKFITCRRCISISLFRLLVI